MSQVQTGAKLMTADEFYDWVLRPENEAKQFELVRGEVVEVSRPGELHGFVCLSVGSALYLYTEQRQQGYALSNDTGVILERDPDTVRGPDLAYFEQSKPYDDLNPKWLENVPTLVVEVLSPNDRPGKVLTRVGEYLRNGIRCVWLVDPEARDVTVLRSGGVSERFEKDQELLCEDILPGFRWRVSKFFMVPGTRTPTTPTSPPS
jgi:Uma2 family endonuclease